MDNKTIVHYKPLDGIKRYDIVVHELYGKHPCIVFKTDAKYAYLVGLTSTKSDHIIYKIAESRFYKEKFMTNSVIRMSKTEAMTNFAGVFDNRIEADKGFAQLKIFYNNLFRTKGHE